MKIETVWMAVTVSDETGDEAMCAAIVGDDTVPLIAFRAEHVAGMQEQAEDIAVRHGIEVRIIKMTVRRDEGFISGKSGFAMNVKWPDSGPLQG